MPNDWTGKILQKRDLRSTVERAALRDSGNLPVILPYGRFDGSRRPALLIHGAGNPGIMRDVAARLDAGGLQVWFIFYDDLGVGPHFNGKDIGAGITKIFTDHYVATTELDIVAHSVGGIVARCALNKLQDHKWRSAGGVYVGPPRGGFAKVRLRTIDTPWSGFGPSDADSYQDDSPGARLIRGIMKLLGVGGAWELGAGSKTMKKLFNVVLEGVDLQNLVAYRPGKKDWIPSLPESSPKEARTIARCIGYGEGPAKLKLRNICAGLRQDSRFQPLRKAIQRAVIAEEIDLEGSPKDDLVEKLTSLHDAAMPRFEGRHIGVILDKEDDAKDLVDYLVNELCP